MWLFLMVQEIISTLQNSRIKHQNKVWAERYLRLFSPFFSIYFAAFYTKKKSTS